MFAQSGYQKIKIYASGKQLKQLAQAGVCIDHGIRKTNYSFTAIFNALECEAIAASGLTYQVIEADAKVAYQNKTNQHKVQAVCGASNINTPANFALGTMGGFLTYSAMLDALDSMASKYPNLITLRMPVDTGHTIEGRPVYFVKISDNPNVAETEPEIYYSALHHAREPLSMQQLIFYMWYLLENYSSNTNVQHIVNNCQLYFVPCLNPDGYLYNEFTDPSGGGLWRKNRRDNGDGSFGVDLNRNYSMFWGFDDNGSSPSTSSEVYRGIGPASEPEIQMINNFINAHQFVTAFDYHSYGNLLIYPYGHIADFETPDSLIFRSLAETYTAENNFLAGTPNQTVNYTSNGGSVDWLYGEQVSKPKIFDFTPECGPDFWPDPSEIEDLCKQTLNMNMQLALTTLHYAHLADKSPSTLSNITGYLKYQIKNIGLDSTGTFTVSVTPLTGFANVGSSKVYNLAFGQIQTDSIAYTLNVIPFSSQVTYLLQVDNGSFILSDTITKIYTPLNLIYSNDGSNLNALNALGWGVDNSNYVSAPASISDSPNQQYVPNAYSTLTSLPFNLTNASYGMLSFKLHLDVEPDFDYAQVQGSKDGITWIPLCGKYTKPGSIYQDFGQPVYDGFTSGWLNEEISLQPLLGNNVWIRYVFVSDGFVEYDGVFLDDIEINTNVTVGMPENNFNTTVLPNPAQNQITITHQGNQASLQIKATDGRLMYDAVLSQNQRLTLNVSNWPAGIYYYTINGFHTKKIMVLH